MMGRPTWVSTLVIILIESNTYSYVDMSMISRIKISLIIVDERIRFV